MSKAWASRPAAYPPDALPGVQCCVVQPVDGHDRVLDCAQVVLDVLETFREATRTLPDDRCRRFERVACLFRACGPRAAPSRSDPWAAGPPPSGTASIAYPRAASLPPRLCELGRDEIDRAAARERWRRGRRGPPGSDSSPVRGSRFANCVARSSSSSFSIGAASSPHAAGRTAACFAGPATHLHPEPRPATLRPAHSSGAAQSTRSRG